MEMRLGWREQGRVEEEKELFVGGIQMGVKGGSVGV